MHDLVKYCLPFTVVLMANLRYQIPSGLPPLHISEEDLWSQWYRFLKAQMSFVLPSQQF